MADKIKVFSAIGAATEAIIEHGTSGFAIAVEEGFELINGIPDPTIMVALYATDLTMDVVYNIWQWYGGKIDGWRCATNIQTATFRCGGGLIGGIAGVAAFGFFLGPSTPALLAGSFVGACYGSYKGFQFADILNRLFFGLPTDVALEEAYKAFGVSCNSSTKDVNKAYKRYCLKHHPDKGGNNDEFVKGQFYMEIIRADRMQKEDQT